MDSNHQKILIMTQVIITHSLKIIAQKIFQEISGDIEQIHKMKIRARCFMVFNNNFPTSKSLLLSILLISATLSVSLLIIEGALRLKIVMEEIII